MKAHGTTILVVRRNKKVAIAGDGQITLGEVVIKNSAKKIRRLYKNQVLAGFAGSTADALTLFERFERKIDEYQGDLGRGSIELAKEWRSDRQLRRLDAMLIVADNKDTFILSGNGDIIQPDDGVAAIGSGGAYAVAAAKALYENTNMAAKEIVYKAMEITANICIFTNSNFMIEEI